MNRFRNVGKILLVILVTFLFILFSPKTQAISSEEIFKRILVNNFENCYKNALRINTSFEAYRSFDSLMNDGYNLSVEVNSLNAQIWIPALNDSYNSMNNVVNTAGARVTSCYALFNGNKNSREYGLKGDMSGLFQIYNKVPPAVAYGIPVSLSALNNFMGDVLKYEVKTDGVSKTDYCYEVHLAEGGVTAGEDTIIGKYCRSGDNYPIGQYGKTSFEPYNSSYSVSGSYTQDVIYEESDDMIGIPVGDPYFGIKVQKGDKKDCSVLVSYDPEEYKEVYCVKRVKLPLDKPTVGAVYDSFYSKEGEESWPTSDKNRIYVKITTEESTGGNSSKTTYKKDSKKWNDSLSAITNNAFSEGVAFSDANKYDFYLQYLARYYSGGKVTVNAQSCQENKPNLLVNNDEGKYYIWAKGKGWCLAKLNENAIKNSYNLTVFKNNQRYKLDKIVKNVGELIELMGELDYSNPDDFVSVEAIGEPDDPVDPGTPSTGDGDNCFNNAGALGWILCPVVSGLSDLGGRAYKWIENNFLQIRSSIFSDSGSGIRDAWDNVLTIANTGFIIVFLVVIFSQVTGFGIDNYGIKKLLPKLIVCAVLVNLSYIICELAVDLSNILGNGLNGLLTGMGPELSVSASTYSPGAGQYIVSWGTVGTGVIAVAIGMVLAYGKLGAVMMLFLAILACAVAIIMLFAVLVIRQAGVVVCVVAAPIAILCYLLPNTEKVYKKWFDLFKALLLVYPICGLVVGAGDFMSRIFGNLAGSSDNGGVQLGFALGAMIVQVLPFFFVPTILKGSLTAMGTVGAKIQGWGSKIGKGVTSRANNRVKNSTAFKNSQELAAERRTRIRAGIGKDGKARKVSGFGKFLRGGDRNMARARAQYLKSQDARNREENLMGVGFAAATIGQEKRAERDELADYMTLINNETRNGEDDVALGEMYNDYIQNGNKAGAVAVARIAGRRKDTAAAFLRNYVTNDSLTSGYNDAQREILRSVSKEVSTGENSGMYRESTPLGFEFAAQMNRGTAGTNSYNEWLGKQDERGSFANVHRAMENYITDTKQLVGVKGASLKEIGNLMGRDEMVTDKNGNTTTKRHNQQMDAEDLARVSTLATQAIENRDKPGANWDSTKAEDLCRISGKYDYNRKTGEITLKPEYANAGLANGGVAEGENFNVREAGATVSGEVASGASVGGGNTEFNVRSMDDDTLLDLATSPGVPNNNSLRTVAEQEYARRNPGYVGGRANSGNGTGSGNGVNPGNNAANG